MYIYLYSLYRILVSNSSYPVYLRIFLWVFFIYFFFFICTFTFLFLLLVLDTDFNIAVKLT